MQAGTERLARVELNIQHQFRLHPLSQGANIHIPPEVWLSNQRHTGGGVGFYLCSLKCGWHSPQARTEISWKLKNDTGRFGLE